MAEITRGDALALMAEERAPEIWKGAQQESAALQTFARVNMGKREKVIPFVDVLPAAPSGGAFVSGDTGHKPTLEMSWAVKEMVAEEIAGIVPIPENVLEDSDYDLWAEVKPNIDTYVARAIDAAVFSGINAPASWPAGGLVQVATAAGNVLDLSTYLATGTQDDGVDLAGAFNELLGLVEDDGFDADRLYVKKNMKRRIRNLRDLNGNPIFIAGLRGANEPPSLWDTDLAYVPTPAFASNVLSLAASSQHAILGLRTDMQWKVLDQATLTQSMTINGTEFRAVAASLAEQDMLALRFKLRLGFTYMDPTTWEGGSGASPFAVMVD